MTALLTYWVELGSWKGTESLKLASSMVDLGAVLYGMIAVLVERGVRMIFWALDERRKWREKWRAEAQAKGRAEGHAEGRAEGHAEGRAEGRAEGQTELLTEALTAAQAEGNQEAEALLKRLARERGVGPD